MSIPHRAEYHPLMGRTALLLHEPPDAPPHFDWLLERDHPDAPLIAFRIDFRLDAAIPAAFDATRLKDHRKAYLTYEGPIPAPRDGETIRTAGPASPRGRVTRLATGSCTISEDTPQSLKLTVHFGDRSHTLAATPIGRADVIPPAGLEPGKPWCFMASSQ